VYTVKQVQINGQPWIDGLHINSEVENYYSRYLATTKGNIAVLITFSGHKQHYTKYSADFYKAIQSLRVLQTSSSTLADGRGNHPGGYGNKSQETFGQGTALGPGLPLDQLPEEDVSGFSDTQTKVAALALLLAAIGFYLLKKRKKG
ncbi:MAG: LPXTG cell wall anchor domain-containing protein, partial [Bdellovibrionales bacterium]|nr:LPXTG cell wall anchor domain-containing protein [Bdellovibrionales bacterium]